MAEYWATWLEAIGHLVPRTLGGKVAVRIEISPQFASSKEEFVAKARGMHLPPEGDIVIGPDGDLLVAA
jgi:hypothetical protein